MASTHQLTPRQIHRMDTLPMGHKVVSARRGVPIVRRGDGQLFRMQPNGHLTATIRVERVQSYLDVHG